MADPSELAHRSQREESCEWCLGSGWVEDYDRPDDDDTPKACEHCAAGKIARLQSAVDRAHGALRSSAYVGGPSEREAWQTALRALGEVATQHQGVNPDAG